MNVPYYARQLYNQVQGRICSQIFSKHSVPLEFQQWKQDKEMEWIEEGQLPNDRAQSREILIALQRNLGHVEGNVQSSYNWDSTTSSENKSRNSAFRKTSLNKHQKSTFLRGTGVLHDKSTLHNTKSMACQHPWPLLKQGSLLIAPYGGMIPFNPS